MRYCPNCQRVEEQDVERCPVCRKQMKRKIEDTDPVFLMETSILESERIEAALEDEGIPYASRTPKKEPSATIVTGNKNAGIYLYVPFEVYEKAKDVVIGIGALRTEEETQVIMENTESKDEKKEKAQDEFTQMSPGKRLAVRIVSVILFILVVWAVVAGTDFIMNLIKGL